MTERTNEELADALHDHAGSLAFGRTFQMLREAEAALRAMPEGERIEGYVWSKKEASNQKGTAYMFVTLAPGPKIPESATLILHERKGGEPCVTFELSRDDEGNRRLERLDERKELESR